MENFLHLLKMERGMHARATWNARSTLAALALLIALAALTACAPEAPPRGEVLAQRDDITRRSIETGDIIGGVSELGAHVWRGLRYAQPPRGALRWRAPQPPTRQPGLFEALAHPPACPQFASEFGGRPDAPAGEPHGDEDCLHLNVFAPPFAPADVPGEGARRPVMVWIHGGGNSIGDALFYDGSRLAHDNNVVVVVPQYRLGPFGWFRHPALREGASPEEASGNFGTLDLLHALAWVQRNIARFGGDPENVTVFGESAGGRNIYSLLLSPKSAGLFHRAIVQSGTPGFLPPAAGETPDPNARVPNSSVEVAARLLGERAEGAPAEVAAALRAAPADAVLNAYAGARELGMLYMPMLFTDGVVLPAGDPLDALSAGAYQRVPVMLGTTRDETKLFQFADPAQVFSLFGVPLFVKDADAYERSAEYLSKWWKLGGVDEPARRMQAHGPVWAYRFDWDEQPDFLWLSFSKLLGAAHALEIPFVFGGFRFGGMDPALLFSPETEASRELLSEQMRSYWTAFAWRGDPGRGRDGTLPAWTPWDESRATADRFMVLDTEADGGLRMSASALTRAGIFEQIAKDARFESAAQRCELLDALGERAPLNEAERALGGCVVGGSARE